MTSTGASFLPTVTTRGPAAQPQRPVLQPLGRHQACQALQVAFQALQAAFQALQASEVFQEHPVRALLAVLLELLVQEELVQELQVAQQELPAQEPEADRSTQAQPQQLPWTPC